MKLTILNLDTCERDLDVYRSYLKFCQENPGYCPFTDRRSLRKEYNHWLVKQNDYPYKNITDHLLLFPKRKVSHLTELTDIESREMNCLLERYKKRNYQATLNGRSESSIPGYLHWQLTQSTNKAPMKLLDNNNQ